MYDGDSGRGVIAKRACAGGVFVTSCSSGTGNRGCRCLITAAASSRRWFVIWLLRAGGMSSADWVRFRDGGDVGGTGSMDVRSSSSGAWARSRARAAGADGRGPGEA